MLPSGCFDQLQRRYPKHHMPDGDKYLPFRTKNLGEFGENCPIYKSELRINVTSEYLFLWARPMHQGGRNGATKHFFVRERARLLVLFPKSVTVQTKSLGGNLEKNAQSTKPNYASTCRAIILFLGSANAPRRAQRSHQATFSCEKGRAY